MTCEPGAAFYGNRERDKWVDRCQGTIRTPAQGSTVLSRRLCGAECVVSGPHW